MGTTYDCQKISYGQDRRNEPVYPGEPTDCAGGPNALWVSLSFLKQYQERYAPGDPYTAIWESKGPLVNVYRFEPGIALPTFVGEMRTAILAMQIDLGGADVSKMDPSSPEYRRFKAKYAGVFQRYIDFLTYYPRPSDQTAGNSPYALGAGKSLSISYKMALDLGEQTDVATWETIDRLRDLLTYAQGHGTAVGWRYSKPSYIAQYEPPPAHAGTGAMSSMSGYDTAHAAAEGATSAPGPDDAGTFLIGGAPGSGAYEIDLSFNAAGHTLSAKRSPFWARPDLTSVLTGGGYSVVGLTGGGDMLEGTIGASDFASVPAGAALARQGLTASFGGGDGVVYGITQTGALLWTSVRDGYAAAPKQVGTGWGGFRQVVSAGQGVIYALTSNGDLLWYHHKGYLDGTFNWEGPITVASGWNRYARIAASTNGVIVAVNQDGSADYYHHRDYLTGVSVGPGVAVSGSVSNSYGAQSRLGASTRPPAGGPGATMAMHGGYQSVNPSFAASDIPRAHIAGPYPLSGANLAQFQSLSGDLDTTLGSGRIK